MSAIFYGPPHQGIAALSIGKKTFWSFGVSKRTGSAETQAEPRPKRKRRAHTCAPLRPSPGRLPATAHSKGAPRWGLFSKGRALALPHYRMVSFIPPHPIRPSPNRCIILLSTFLIGENLWKSAG